MRKLSLYVIIFIFVFSINIKTTYAVEYGRENAVNILNGQVSDTNQFNEGDDFHQVVKINEYTNEYINYPKGYSIQFANYMNLDTSESLYKTSFTDGNSIMDIYYDKVNFNVYTNYSNKFLSNRQYHNLETDKRVKINGNSVRIIKWSRKKLERLDKDYNYYASAEIKKSNNEVYTVILKSQQPIQYVESLLQTMKFFDKKGTAKINKMYDNKHKKWNDETKEFYKNYLTSTDKVSFGIFEPTAPTDMNYLHTLEDRLGYDFSVLVKYQSLDSKIDIEDLKRAYDDKKIVELTLQTSKADLSLPVNKNISYDILDGEYDHWLKNYAKNIKKFGKPVLFRLNNEMNGDWCTYSSYYYSKDTLMFNELWKYVYKIFEDEGVDNVIWVWNPNDKSFPNFSWNHYLNYYPGDEYVDVIGLTGYNTGNYYKGEVWREFDSIYTPVYDEYSKLFKQPFMITEFGSNDVGGDKINWVNNMFDTIENYPRIKIAIWWNGIDWDGNGNPARTYRLDTNEDLMNSFKNGFQKIK